MEKWIKFPYGGGFYECSDLGRIKSLHGKGRVLKKSLNKDGYEVVSINILGNKKQWKVHQIIWISFNSDYDKSSLVIDHKNHNRKDNRLNNLRLVTHRENATYHSIKTSSRFPGVYIQVRKYKGKTYNYWRAQIQDGEKQKYLGLFKSEEKAHEAYQNHLNNIVGYFISDVLRHKEKIR